MARKHSKRSAAKSNNSRNVILNLIPKSEFPILSQHLEYSPLTHKKIIYQPNDSVEAIYFVETGVISILSVLQEGGSIEIATVGNEGVVGISSFFGTRKFPLKAIVQIEGEAYRMPVEKFEHFISKNNNSLSTIVRRYAQALFTQLAQSVACNRVHNIEQRCAKWLLQTSDRANSEKYALTQEFLGQMLGVRRASVNAVERDFQQRGLIRYKRGFVEIVDRAALGAVTCDCYRIIRDEYEDFQKMKLN
jgi:CRP-like cAMP-binding protein